MKRSWRNDLTLSIENIATMTLISARKVAAGVMLLAMFCCGGECEVVRML